MPTYVGAKAWTQVLTLHGKHLPSELSPILSLILYKTNMIEKLAVTEQLFTYHSLLLF